MIMMDDISQTPKVDPTLPFRFRSKLYTLLSCSNTFITWGFSLKPVLQPCPPREINLPVPPGYSSLLISLPTVDSSRACWLRMSLRLCSSFSFSLSWLTFFSKVFLSWSCSLSWFLDSLMWEILLSCTYSTWLFSSLCSSSSLSMSLLASLNFPFRSFKIASVSFMSFFTLSRT